MQPFNDTTHLYIQQLQGRIMQLEDRLHTAEMERDASRRNHSDSCRQFGIEVARLRAYIETLQHYGVEPMNANG